MRASFAHALVLSALAASAGACVGTTGSDTVTFRAFAAGPPEASAGLSFVNGHGWSITLTRATARIGAVYLNRSAPISGAQEGACFLPGVYVAEVLSGVEVDALSPELQPFPELGSGTADPAATGEVWLTRDRVDAPEDGAAIADVAGTATRGAESFPFEGRITIGPHRMSAGTDPARPGANPLCAERIVRHVLPAPITPTAGGALVVRVDPRAWLANVDLGELEPVSPESELRRIPDDATPVSHKLYVGVRSASTGAYRFEWLP